MYSNINHYNKKYTSWSKNDPKLIRAMYHDKIVLKELFSKIQKNINNSVLELGCGVGYKSQIIYELGYKVKAIDFSEVAIERARRWWDSGIVFSCEDFYSITELSQYDILYTSSFSPIRNQFKVKDSEVFNQIFRMIKSGGYLIFEWGRNSHYEEKHNDWSFISIKDILNVMPKYGDIQCIYANHRQLAPILKHYYFSKLITKAVMAISKIHRNGYRLYTIIKKY